jgi:hypothetical protein
MGPVSKTSGTERHQRRRESKRIFATLTDEVKLVCKAETRLCEEEI